MKLKIMKLNLANSEGSSALGMVVVMLFLSLLLMSSLGKTSLSWQKNFINHHIYYQHFNIALSSIEWGVTQTWPAPTQDWQCQSLSTYHLVACVKQSSRSTNHYVLVKGQSKQLVLYHLATFQQKTGNVGTLTIERGHWLDYCPEPQGDDCD